MSQRGAGQPGLAMPHDLMAGVRVMLAVAIAPKMGNEAHGVAEPARGREVVLARTVVQEGELVVGEHQMRLAVGHLTPEQRHDHDAPGNHRVDGDGPLQPLGGAEQQELDPAPGLQDPE